MQLPAFIKSKFAKAKERIMGTGAVPLTSTLPEPTQSQAAAQAKAATEPKPEMLIKKLGSMFAHGVAKTIAFLKQDRKPIENIALVAGTLAGVGPEVQAAEDTFDLIFGEVLQVQQVATAVGASDGNGEQKLLVAAPQVESIILANPLFKGKKIADLDKWNAAIKSITGSVYDLANSVEAGTLATDAPAAK